jgi:tetratricopeptide (TPR) repeat protein
MSTDPRLDGIIDDVLQLHPDASARSPLDLDRMLHVLDSIFAKMPETTIIVDALNECRDQNATRLYEYLNTLSEQPRIRVIILSRQDADMEAIFQDAEIINMDRSKVERDITHYVKARIDRKPALQDISSQILEKVSVGCQEMFLWVKFMLDDLERADTLNDQLEILKQTPAHLFDAFERLFLQTSGACTVKQRRTRHEIFLMLVGAKRPLTVDEVSSLIALDVRTNSIDKGNEFKSPRRTVEKLCRPFVTFTEGKVQLVHAAVKEFLLQRHMTLDESNAFLVEKCLSELSQEKYSLLQYTAALLRKHLLPNGLVGLANADVGDDGPVPYDYAALHWQDHLVALSRPSNPILSKLAEFISSNAAVTWSERLLDIIGGGGLSNITAEIAVLATLTAWANLLPPPTRDQVPIDEFFVSAHDKIRKQLEDDGQDTLLPFVPAIRLGQFFSIGGKSYAEFKKAYYYKKIVVDGFTRVLGKRSPLTLSARTTFINEYFSQERIDEAEAELEEVVAIELEVLGEDSIEYFNTLQLFGSAQFCLTKYEDASKTLQKSGDGLCKLLGSTKFPYLANLLFHGYVVERQADLKEARRMFETIWTTWTPLMGKSHPLSLMAQTAVSSVYRKEGNYELAKENLLPAWASRLRLFSLNSNTTVDSGVQLAITYREMSLGSDALELLDIIEKSNVFETDFERTCQVAHIRALVAFDRGYFDEPKLDLLKLIDKTTGDRREGNNRECLWIRTTLADALRQHGDDADALMLFSELVGPARDGSDAGSVTPSLMDEPESPAQLAIAEQALRLVKAADVVGAQELLTNNGLRWLRLKDFWNRQGGPIADTACMKPVELAPALRKSRMDDTKTVRVLLPRPPG